MSISTREGRGRAGRGADRAAVHDHHQRTPETTLTSTTAEALAEYSDFLNTGISSEVQDELEYAIRRELEVDENEKRKIIGIYRQFQQRLFQSFQNSKGISPSDMIGGSSDGRRHSQRTIESDPGDSWE